MKKALIAVLCAGLLLGTTACGKNNTQPANTENTEEDTATAAQEEKQETEPEYDGEFNSDWGEASEEAQPIQTGQMVTEEELIAFSVEKVYWSEDLQPSVPDQNYNYIETEDGNCFLVCEGTVENLSSGDIELSSSMGPLWGAVATVFIFDDTEAYYGDWYAGTGSISYNLAAGAKDTLYIAVSVPEKMKESAGKVQLLTGFADLKEKAGTPIGTETGINWPALSHKYLLDVSLP